MITIHLQPAGKTLRAAKGASLKDVLFEHGVEFPCGGKGRCKGCKIRVLAGELAIHEEERERLSPSELAQGWRLACLGRAKNDLTIELAQWEARILSDDTRFVFTPRPGGGIAFDIGTTTIVGQYVDLTSGSVLAVHTALNSQAQHGADIMSRIEYAVSEQGQGTLQRMIREQLEEMIRALIQEAGSDAPPARDIVLVGNTVMHQLFCGVDVEPLSHYPFEPASPGLHEFEAGQVGWELPGNPVVRFLPCLGGFVGSDLLAGIFATGMDRSQGLRALMDLGTNGEIVVGNGDQFLCASTAAGPAFEGARISMGMRAATGAISEVIASNGSLKCRTLGEGKPRGVCGSGLVDAVAVGRELGLIRPNGRLVNGDALMLSDPVQLSQWDIRELQMAKGAIAAGLQILLREYGAEPDQLECLYLAGAFGNYVSIPSARRIGLLNLPEARIVPVGNAALRGGRMALFAQNEAFMKLPLRVRHTSLHEAPGFHDVYVEAMAFP